MHIPDILDQLDWIDRVEGIIFTFRRADWRGAIERHGALGIMREFVACLTAHATVEVRVTRGSSWSGIAIERLLGRHGVRLGDRGATSTDLHFRVERRQAGWAEYLMLRAGVPVVSRFDERNHAMFDPRSNRPVSEPVSKRATQ